MKLHVQNQCARMKLIDRAAATLNVIKTPKSNIFVGYTAADWSGSTIKYDSTAFLFSLVKSYNIPVKMNHNNLPGKCQVICYCDPYYAVVFGGCQDIECYNSLNDCYSNMAYSYKLTSFYQLIWRSIL